MAPHELDAVAPEARETAGAALDAAFGSASPARLRAVTGGASGALLYAVEVGRREYLLRIETRRSPLRNPHQYACMRAAADAGIAPRIHFVDGEAGVAVMDYVATRPFDAYPGGPENLARELGALASRLQGTTPFPALADYAVIVARMLDRLRTSGMFRAGLLDPHAEALARIRAAYPWEAAAQVSSHNDPNPRNLIYDGERIWLVDWETAYRNDPMVDVAILADNFATTPALENALLAGWLGRVPNRNERARLTLMRPLTRLYYAGLLLMGFASAPRQEPDDDLAAPTPDEFRAAIVEGRVRATSAEAMYLLGKMCLAGLLAGVRTPAFDEACAALQAG